MNDLLTLVFRTSFCAYHLAFSTLDLTRLVKNFNIVKILLLYLLSFNELTIRSYFDFVFQREVHFVVKGGGQL